jgi:hypothetical protein
VGNLAVHTCSVSTCAFHVSPLMGRRLSKQLLVLVSCAAIAPTWVSTCMYACSRHHKPKLHTADHEPITHQLRSNPHHKSPRPGIAPGHCSLPSAA